MTDPTPAIPLPTVEEYLSYSSLCTHEDVAPVGPRLCRDCGMTQEAREDQAATLRREGKAARA